MKRISLVSAVALTLLLLWAGLSPTPSAAFAAGPHWVPHLVSFAALGFAWARGVPRVPTPIVALAVIAFGFAHEALEIVGHTHGYELADAIVDGAGATCGALIAHATKTGSDLV